VSVMEKGQSERRHSDRFPIEREVRFKVLNKRGGEETGEGKTLNISSSGILFTSEQMLLPGRRLEVAINWPVQLNNNVALKLVARGRVVRAQRRDGGRGDEQVAELVVRLDGKDRADARGVGEGERLGGRDGPRTP